MKIKSNFKFIIHMNLVVLLTVFLSIKNLAASDQIPAAKQDHPIALIGGTIHTVTGSTIKNGVIVFVDGKITAIGTNVELPEGTEQINVQNKHIYPGMIAAYTTLGLVEVSSVRATRDMAEIGDINPSVRAEAAINPDSELFPVARANGITLAPLAELIHMNSWYLIIITRVG